MKAWKLKKTLKRRTHFRPIEQEDVQYVWVAYKSGLLESMGPPFDGTDMSPEEFQAEFIAQAETVYHAIWTLFADTKKGYLPVGLVLGFWSHPDPSFGRLMNVGDMIWFPWTSKRNKVEASVNFFNDIRKEVPMVEYAKLDDKKFFETIAKHGIMRRVGTMHNIYDGEPAAVFETRAA